ncbi:MAG: BspA family leucine-rich repeat surface protein, partial [Ekhidna sp.]|nr:BspA family leucine-rich repeat surface protein [Ekhidna sp.]
MNGAFWNCDFLTIADDAGIPNLSNVTDMSGTFEHASFKGDISKWDVSSVTDMSYMFQNSDFNGDISNWNVSSVTNMVGMFSEDRLPRYRKNPFNRDLSGWDVSSVTDMSYIFLRSSFNGDISKWDVSSVTSMNDMFFRSSFTGDLSKWDISKVVNMLNMFSLNTSMSSENYDKLLIGWSTLDRNAGETKIPSGITFGAPAHYTCEGASARESLITTYSWVIEEDSKVDAIPPTPGAESLSAVTAQCEVTADDLTAPIATDNCPGAVVTVEHDVAEDAFPITEDRMITWTYRDEAGNEATQTQA